MWLGTTLLSDSLAVAAQSLVARSLAARQPAAARTVVRRTAQLSGALGVALLGGLGACHGLLPRAFSSDPAVLAAVRLRYSRIPDGFVKTMPYQSQCAALLHAFVPYWGAPSRL